MNDPKYRADKSYPPLPQTPAEYADAEDGEHGFDADSDMGQIFGASQLKEIIGALQAELDKKSAEVSEKNDLYMRSIAEMENVRRRLEKEKEETAKYAISKFAKDVLSVGDNFQRAIAAVPADAAASDPTLKNFLDGVMLAERDFQAALERHGVTQIDPAGQAFNPHHHQAVMEKDDATVPNGTVLQVFQLGYLIDDRCLRPAMVVVSRGGAKTVKTAEGAGSGVKN